MTTDNDERLKKFSPGDLVALKGYPGLKMVVRYTIDSRAARATNYDWGVCVDWVGPDGEPYTQTFGPDQLEHVPTASETPARTQ